MNTATLLKELASIPAVSGREDKIGRKITSFFSFFEIDRSGNVIVPGVRDILIEAHMDEVGFIKTETGFVKVGDIEDKDVDEKNITSIDNTSFFKRRFEEEGTIVRSPALDNKVGCTALILAAKEICEHATIAFTVQEETTYAGIQSITQKIRPRTIISIDSAYAQPFPQDGWQIPICGKGPAIQVQGKGFLTDAQLVKNVADREGIPCQFEIVDPYSGATNLTAVKEDVRKIQINIPVKYQHGPMGEADVRDIENTAKLIVAVVNECARKNI